MRRLFTFACVVGTLWAAGRGLAQDQGQGQGRATEVELLKKEIDLLKRELDLLKRENELLKKQLAAKKGGPAQAEEGQDDAVLRITVDDVEYVYQGSVRQGSAVIVTVLATSKNGNKPAPMGRMTLVDTEGEKYHGNPLRGVGLGAQLREGVPVKLAWTFGGANAFTGAAQPGAPSPKLTRFAGVFIERGLIGRGDDTIDFRNVPAVLAPKSKKK